MSKIHSGRRRKVRMLDEEARKRHRRMLDANVGKSGMWPLNAPGMPPPGKDFLRAAEALGDETRYEKGTKQKEGVYEPGEQLKELYRRALREPFFNLDVEIKRGVKGTVTFVPGHLWGQHRESYMRSVVDHNYEAKPVDGPHPADVMILGKMPWREETREGRNLLSDTGEILMSLVKKMHLKHQDKWYVTNLCKFMPPEELGTSTLKAPWIHDCLPLLHQELRIVKPKYILCLGADASKWLLGNKYNVSYMAGRVVPYTYPIHFEGEEPETHTAHVMTVLHPVEVARSPEKIRILQSNFARFAYLLEGHNFDLAEQGLDHRAYYYLEDAQDWVEEVNAFFAERRRRDRLVGLDLEWQGQHPHNEGAYIRTIQIAWDEKKSACFVLHHPGGKCAFRDRDGRPAIKRLLKLLNRFMKDKRPVGHFLVSDLEHANYHGFFPTKHWPIPLEPKNGKPAFERMRDGEGWLDTAYINHAVEETAPLGLEMVAMRYTNCPRYDIALEDEIKAFCKKENIKREALEGYGMVPDKILVPYGNYDADATLRAAKSLVSLLDSDYEGNNSWEAFWESMIIQPVILTMHQNGILVDRHRIDDLTKKFLTARAGKEELIRSWAGWPEFNIRSPQQVREFLFGERYNGKVTKDGSIVRIRPRDAKSLHVEPLLDTSKPPRYWSDLKQRGLDKEATPGTNKLILSILAQENLNVSNQISMVRDYRFLDQVLKSVLRHPRTDEEDQWVENEDGLLEYDAGLAASIDADGRVRTHIYPTAETGRCKHSRPNLANLSKSRDPDYLRLLGKDEHGRPHYDHKLRSILIAAPGYAFIEADYKGAELESMAIMSGAQKMQEHCRRANTFPEEGYSIDGEQAVKGHRCPGDCKTCRKQGKTSKKHICTGACSLCGYPSPEYYDIHSNVAILAFQLECHASKFGLELISKSHFRTLAKNVIFGIAYGRGAKAIALQAREQGVKITPEQAQIVIDAIFEMYPELVDFFEAARSRALEEKWLCNCYGRRRRFPTISDYKMEGEFERQAMNFPIQSMVASAVDRGLAWLHHEIERQGLGNDIRLLLQMHDALLAEVKYALVPYAKKLIHWAMVDMVEIWPTTLDGVQRGDGPYHFGLDMSVEERWGEKFSQADMERLGMLEEAA